MPILHLWTKTQVLFYWGSLKVFPLSCDLWGSLWEWRKKKKNHNSLTKITRKNNIIHTVGRQQILWHPCPLSPLRAWHPFPLFYSLRSLLENFILQSSFLTVPWPAVRCQEERKKATHLLICLLHRPLPSLSLSLSLSASHSRWHFVRLTFLFSRFHRAWKMHKISLNFRKSFSISKTFLSICF